MGVEVVASGDEGKTIVQAHPHSESAKAFARIVRPLLESDIAEDAPATPKLSQDGSFKIAIPVAHGQLCMHFGHCERFAIFDVDPESKTILGETMLDPPAHEPGVFPRWLHEQRANLIITGGMGARAQSLFAQNNIKVVVGAAAGEPKQVVTDYLEGKLKTGENVCDH